MKSPQRIVLAIAAGLAAIVLAPAAAQAAPCTSPVTNPIACENSKAGSAPESWEVEGSGDPTIQGFATSQSVNKGETISFKIKAPSNNYSIDILRLGYYDGDGARLIDSNLAPTGSSNQPSCLNDSTLGTNTGIIDCGNWSVSRSWTVPSDAVSGVYMAHLIRNDTGGDSQILFVVRDDSSHADLMVQTSDSTWQAYNAYGGNSLYTCTVECPTGDGTPKAYAAAYKVSYNRPLDTADHDARSSFFGGGEYPMVRFLEANGYNASYMSSSDVASRGSLLLNHKVFLSSGHDEYWSGSQRTSMETARNSGVNLAFFSGNEGYWKTRWENSNRTLVAYKDTHFDRQIDPVSWTGTWGDSRFAAAADDVTPQNELTGQLFTVNSGTTDIEVPSTYKSLRFWRNTSVATLANGAKATLAANTLGYEWDVDADNGFRPAGSIRLSSTTAGGLEVFQDYGSTTAFNQTATHNMTLYKAPSGALVFGSGTVQWSWGLDDFNAGNTAPNLAMKQATVNLFADMGVQPYALTTGLVAATKSTDTTAPTATFTSPPSSVADGANITLQGTATDAGGGVVAGVEVSTDGGSTWHPANGTTSWTYAWNAHGNPTANLKVRATDDSGNIQTPGAGSNVTVNCPCSVWGTGFTPPDISSDDTNAIEVGVKFRSDTYGAITGIRFYKVSGNTGTHTGSLWTADGQRLAQATFISESATGWQTVTFASPVAVMPNTTYVASYYAPNGRYAATADYLWRNSAPTPLGGAVTDSKPLHILKSDSTVQNGVYSYSPASTFPTSTFGAGNYWVDVVYQAIPAAGPVTTPSSTAGRGSATINWTAPASGGTPTSYIVTPFIGSTAQTAKTVTASATNTVVSGLTPGSTYTFKVQATNPAGPGAVSPASNAVTILAPVSPDAPTAVVAEAASQSARVSWTAPAFDGGRAITGYTVTPYIGAAAQAATQVSPSTTSTVITGLTNGSSYSFKIKATNAIGTTESATSSAVVPQFMLFDLDTPAVVDGGDSSAVDLGVKFRADSYGSIPGLRFYKAAANTGIHVGTLWSATGAQLARATFTGESASGWQTVTFDTPVEVTPGTTYVASYFAPNGHYSITTNEFASAVDSPPLHGLANATSPNGVYAYSSAPAFPDQNYIASNYWIDVTYMPTPPPGQVTGVTATAGRTSATVTWSAPATGGAPSSYQITPYIGATAQTTKTISGSPLATTTTISGLTAGTSYTFRVRAVNNNGSGTLSAGSNAVSPLTPIAPAAPTGVTAIAASASAQVRWTAPDDGGSPITGYTVTPLIDGVTQTPVAVPAANTIATLTGLTNGAGYTFRVSATNAVGSTQSTASTVVFPQRTVFDFGTPGTVDGGDGLSVEVGVKFQSDVDGEATGLRFYKAAANTGTHVGTLWSATGSVLARATFANETASGWQTVRFDTPVDLTAGTTYVASYYAPNGHYSLTGNGFSSAVVNVPLRALANSASPNGVFIYNNAPAFPTGSYGASNYWVDVTFQPTPTPGVVTGVTATAGAGSAGVSWTAPSGGGAPTSYEVTPYIGATAQAAKTVAAPATTTSVTGLTAGTAYTFRVRARNTSGFGDLSAASAAVTPTGTSGPTAPTAVAATPATQSARVTWTAPSSDGGNAITGYMITPYIGAAAQATTAAATGAASATVTGLTNGTSYTFRVSATNSAGTTQSSASGAVIPRQALFDFGTPATIDVADDGPIEIGVKFKSDVAGQITGLRFYKAPTNTGTHVGTLWTAAGIQLGRATFSDETASGWQTVLFAAPVAVTAGETYVASYYAPNGHYSATGAAFTSVLNSGPLHSIANATSPNGTYIYTGSPAFPTGDYNATNYWVDVLFAPGGGE